MGGDCCTRCYVSLGSVKSPQAPANATFTAEVRTESGASPTPPSYQGTPGTSHRRHWGGVSGVAFQVFGAQVTIRGGSLLESGACTRKLKQRAGRAATHKRWVAPFMGPMTPLERSASQALPTLTFPLQQTHTLFRSSVRGAWSTVHYGLPKCLRSLSSLEVCCQRSWRLSALWVSFRA